MKLVPLILLGIAVVIVILGLTLSGHDPVEPAYGGKKLGQWLVEANSGHWPRKGLYVPADEAIRQIGTNALPMLDQMLRSRNSAIKSRWVSFVNPQLRFLGFRHITTDAERQQSAIAGCYALGWDAQPLIPTVAKALDHMTPSCQIFAVTWLASRGPQAKAAVPALVAMLQNKTNSVRVLAAEYLPHICGDRRDEVVAVLKAGLQGTDSSVQLACRRALEDLGEIPQRSQVEGNVKLRQAAEAGDVKAQVQLATSLFSLTPHTTADWAEAYKWATIAAARENREAKYLVKELEVFLAPKEVAEGRAAAQTLINAQKDKTSF